MEISVRNKITGLLEYSFDTGNPFAIFIGYQRIDHEKYKCFEPNGKEYLPYICDKCQTRYGGHISTPCPNCGRNE